uniref:Secreted protein n=1 Tax=Panagrellus redivivus TaxID=6233 RepID=A0A7E4UMM3_PANRE
MAMVMIALRMAMSIGLLIDTDGNGQSWMAKTVKSPSNCYENGSHRRQTMDTTICRVSNNIKIGYVMSQSRKTGKSVRKERSPMMR